MTHKHPAIIAALGAALAISIVPVPAFAVDEGVESPSTQTQAPDGDAEPEEPSETLPKGSWEHSEKGWKYLVNGVEVAGYQVIDDIPYYFDAETHLMATGWAQDDTTGVWYYAASSGALDHDTWRLLGSTWYWFDNESRMVTDLVEIGGSYYYFSDTGAMKTGWIYDEEAKTWAYATASGALARGWERVGEIWYYFDRDTCVMQTGRLDLDGTYYELADTGAMRTGWIYDGEAETWYYADDSGCFHTGWLLLDDTWYFMHTTNCRMLTGWFSYWGDEYYLTDSGAMATGWIMYQGNWYYADSSGRIAKQQWSQVNDNWYHFGKYGAMDTGLTKVGDDVYFFTESGSMATSWISEDSHWYYFEQGGAAAKSKWIGDYYLLEDGTMATSQWIDGKYYVGEDGKWIPEYKEPETDTGTKPEPNPDSTSETDTSDSNKEV